MDFVECRSQTLEEDALDCCPGPRRPQIWQEALQEAAHKRCCSSASDMPSIRDQGSSWQTGHLDDIVLGAALDFLKKSKSRLMGNEQLKVSVNLDGLSAGESRAVSPLESLFESLFNDLIKTMTRHSVAVLRSFRPCIQQQ